MSRCGSSLLGTRCRIPIERQHSQSTRSRTLNHLDRFPPQDEEGLTPLGEETGELVDQNVLDLVRLLDPDADADRVDGRLDQDSLVLIARNGQGRQEDLGGRLGLNLGDVVSLSRLGSEVGERQRGRETAPDALKVRPLRLRLKSAELAGVVTEGVGAGLESYHGC